MKQTSDINLEGQPLSVAPAAMTTALGRLRRASEDTIVWLHRQADRMDLVPTEFGEEASVDREDASSLLREWWRQARLWADYNPEQMLALKAGAVALGAAMLVLVLLVAAIR